VGLTKCHRGPHVARGARVRGSWVGTIVYGNGFSFYMCSAVEVAWLEQITRCSSTRV